MTHTPAPHPENTDIARGGARPAMAEHTYVKYIDANGMSQASPEGAVFKDTITMDGLKIVRSVITPVTDGDRK